MFDVLSLQSGETEGFIWKQANMANPGSVLKNFMQYLKKEKWETGGIRELLYPFHWKQTVLREEMPLQLTDLKQGYFS